MLKDALVKSLTATNLQDGAPGLIHLRRLRRSKHSATNGQDVTVHYPDDGLGIGAIRMELLAVYANLYNNIIVAFW